MNWRTFILITVSALVFGCRHLQMWQTEGVKVMDRSGQPIREASVKSFLFNGSQVARVVERHTDDLGVAVFQASELGEFLEAEAAGFRPRRAGGQARCFTLVALMNFETVAVDSLNERSLRDLCMNVSCLEELADLALRFLPKTNAESLLRQVGTHPQAKMYSDALLVMIGHDRLPSWHRNALVPSQQRASDCIDEGISGPAHGEEIAKKIDSWAQRDLAAAGVEQWLGAYRESLLRRYSSVEVNQPVLGSSSIQLITFQATSAHESAKFMLKLRSTGAKWDAVGFWAVAMVVE